MNFLVKNSFEKQMSQSVYIPHKKSSGKTNCLLPFDNTRTAQKTKKLGEIHSHKDTQTYRHQDDLTKPPFIF
jgi:hypothetical protein